MSRYTVCTSIANVWRSPQSPRSCDQLSLTSSFDPRLWLEQLDNHGLKGRLQLQGRLETQLLYGESVEVTSEQGQWLHICIPQQKISLQHPGYTGWVPREQVCLSPSRDWNCPQVIITDTTCTLTLDGTRTRLPLSFMTSLPWVGELQDEVIVSTPSGKIGKLPLQAVTIVPSQSAMPPSISRRLQLAQHFLGLPYLWGGTSAFGFDCSGFMYRVFAASGVQIPRDASVQAQFGQAILMSEIQAGDLLFFAHEQGNGSIHHVGMYIGDEQFIHAPKTGEHIQIASLASSPYLEELCQVRRYDGSEF
ncbi:C40 family peptidase [Mechercharimyces sp. CAU 1602]|uniref:C40 family peptidase n=1 Tax=Mechercharimyces sp. CAU 1602 TaxID=2973933 RepID=UPI002163F690|nr:C40 family peptidase [Mechercharimyces sp. CAU 1602]MCS1350516.1 C40 family peptidase [Mechercharimyces sp. CAU 1602]